MRHLSSGSVRDRLLGREVNDWDLTTNALPKEVISCFPKVIETGLKHGTVTVILEGEHVEITTYRVDGEYRDGRRPEEVSFTRSLTEDLLRRDFTVNAIAWDPINAELQDPYDGVRDLQKKVLRAVGDPNARFQEDGPGSSERFDLRPLWSSKSTPPLSVELKRPLRSLGRSLQRECR